MDTCSNALYGTETKNVIKHKTDILHDHGQPIYVNTDIVANERSPSVQENDHAYEKLNQKLSLPRRKVPAEKNQEHGQGVIGKEYRFFIFVFGGLMFALFCMVTGVAVALGVLHTSGDLHHSWEPWALWSPCSVTCDFGISLRKRNCSSGDSKTGFTDCVGDASEYRLCNEALCDGLALNGGWSEWLSWGTCSTTCDAGLQSRQRTCSNPRPSSGGEHCFGDSLEYRLCKLRGCPGVNGGWGVWSAWGTCSTTCEAGLQTRKRTCSNPQPSNGGEHCFGESADYRSCNLRTCPSVNGEWDAWSTWDSCSTTCGTGLQSRQRNCSNPRPSNGGEHCFGESTDYRSCHLTYCSVNNGYWSSWSSWSSCSSACTKTRTRSCTTYTGGRQCLGNSFDKENCLAAGCAIFALTELQVRLNGSSNEGRIEVSIAGSEWGTVCDDDFDINDARVACRMLGYTGNYSVVNANNVPDGSGPIYLDDLACVGTESSLLYCRHSGWGRHNCGHSEDVGVSCY